MGLSLALALLNHGTTGVAGSLLANPPPAAPAPAVPAAPKAPSAPTN
jgi:hypothetical protein